MTTADCALHGEYTKQRTELLHNMRALKQTEKWNMSMSITFFIACFAILIQHVKTSNDYQGDKVLEVLIRNANEWKIVQQIMDDHVETVDQWKEPLLDGDTTHLHISRTALKTVTSLLDRYDIEYRVIIEDVQRLIDQEKASNEAAKVKRRKREAITSVSNGLIGTFATLDEIYTWLRHVDDFFPEITELKSIGLTYEQRHIMLVKIGIPKPYTKPAIFIEAGAHSREWISPAATNYMIYLLYQGYQQHDSVILKLLSDLDWYFLPIANPDGYVHSHKENRLWRKNRALWPSVLGNETEKCYGVDLNRNYPFHWAEGGSSTKPCSNLYHGPFAGSEKETQAITHFILEHNQTITAFLTAHSYLQLVMTRYSYAEETYPEDHDELLTINKEMAEAMNATHGVKYDYGTSPEHFYAYTGGSPDWVKGKAGIKYSYSTELRDRGMYGFVLPADHIIPNGEELWEGVKVLAKYAAKIEVPQDIVTTTEPPTTTTTTRPSSPDTPKVVPVTGTASSCYINILLRLLLVIGLHTTVFQMTISY